MPVTNDSMTADWDAYEISPDPNGVMTEVDYDALGYPYVGEMVDFNHAMIRQSPINVDVHVPASADTDQTIGGLPCGVMSQDMALGPVESGEVENFVMTGRRIRLRRQAESSEGPVGRLDYLTQLALSYGQQSTVTPTNDQVAYSIIMGE